MPVLSQKNLSQAWVSAISYLQEPPGMEWAVRFLVGTINLKERPLINFILIAVFLDDISSF